jgi:S-(hydroxymethyl)glutathione dehydrogenase / alcohol dehydrogenase
LLEGRDETKGALIWEFNQPWSVEEIEIGDPRKGEVKVQMEKIHAAF